MKKVYRFLSNLASYSLNKPKNFLIFLSLAITLILILFSGAKQYGQIRDSEAAMTTVEFRTDVVKNLSSSQKGILNEYKGSVSIKSSTILKIDDINKVASASKITIPIQDTKVVFTKKALKQPYKQVKLWISESEYKGLKYTSYFAINNGTLVGVVDTGGRKYELMSLDSTKVIMREVNPSKLTRHPDDIVSEINKLDSTSEVLGNTSQAASSTTVVNILAVYTPEFERTFGSVSNAGWQMESFMAMQVESVNQLFYNSLINNYKVQLVDTMEFNLASNMRTTIINIGISDEYNEIYSKRNSTGADVVAIFHNEEDNYSAICGIVRAIGATSSSAYMIVNRFGGCLTVNTFAHEFGHLAGGGHEDHDNDAVSYAHALVYAPGKFFTVMSASAYYGDDYTEVPFFTTPLIIYPPANTYVGTEDYYNNRKRINSYLPLMAGFMNTSSPTVSPGPSSPPAGTGTCGSSCTTVNDCDPNGGYSCIDISSVTPGNECWKDACIISPARNRRISGTVYDCNGNPKSGVKVSSFGFSFDKTSTTDASGKFFLTEGANKCSVEQDAGQTFYVVAGKDADSTQTDFYGRVDNPVFSQSAINCNNINCAYAQNQAPNGPSRENYHLSVNSFTNTPNVYNTYVCEESPNYLSGFDFKQKNCPLACNSTCTTDNECSNVNPNWFCSQQYNYGTWSDDSSYLGTIQYTENGQVKTESGTNYGLNQHVRNGVTEQHLIKNNKLFYRTNTPGTGWSAWTNVTSNVSNVGCNLFTDCGGSIVGFNSYTRPTGKIEQHLLRRNATTFKLFSRNNDNGWSSWTDVTAYVTGVGSGTFTSFTSYVHPDGYTLQNIVRGGVLWERTNLGGWKSWGINNGLNSCVGTGANKCGTTTLLSFEKSILSDGKEVLHVFREGNKNYSRTSTPTDQKCRIKTNIFSNTCQ